MWVYIKSENQLWTVGHYQPVTGEWLPESDHFTAEEAAQRVSFLNGGTDPRLLQVLADIEGILRALSNDGLPIITS